MKRICIAIACCTSVLANAADLPADWRNVQQLPVAQPGLIKLSLSVETLDATRSGLEDLRIYDTTGHEVPYLIEHPAPSEKIVRNAKSFQVALEQEKTIISIETGLAQP